MTSKHDKLRDRHGNVEIEIHAINVSGSIRELDPLITVSKDRWMLLGPSLSFSLHFRGKASLKMATCVNERKFLDKLIKV